jgi:hypothetical protein
MTNELSLFIPYELALRLKILGFNEPCIASYSNRPNREPCFQICGQGHGRGVINYYRTQSYYLVLAPTWEFIFEWFITKHNLKSWIEPSNDKYVVKILNYYSEIFDTYEYARFNRLENLILILGEI